MHMATARAVPIFGVDSTTHCVYIAVNAAPLQSLLAAAAAAVAAVPPKRQPSRHSCCPHTPNAHLVPSPRKVTWSAQRLHMLYVWPPATRRLQPDCPLRAQCFSHCCAVCASTVLMWHAWAQLIIWLAPTRGFVRHP